MTDMMTVCTFINSLICQGCIRETPVALSQSVREKTSQWLNVSWVQTPHGNKNKED